MNLEEQFVSIEIRDAFEIDSVKSARSMTVQKDNIPLDIRDIFDSISYSKGISHSEIVLPTLALCSLGLVGL